MNLNPPIKAIRDWCKDKFQPKGDYALSSAIPTATSQLVNDSEYVNRTSLNFSLAGKANNAYNNAVVNGYDYETGMISAGSNVGNTISNSISSHDNALNDIIFGINSNKEKITNLGGFTPVINETTGEITGYKTAIGGADTVFPFSCDDNINISGAELIYENSMPNSEEETIVLKNNYQLLLLVYKGIYLLNKNMSVSEATISSEDTYIKLNNEVINLSSLNNDSFVKGEITTLIFPKKYNIGDNFVFTVKNPYVQSYQAYLKKYSLYGIA